MVRARREMRMVRPGMRMLHLGMMNWLRVRVRMLPLRLWMRATLRVLRVASGGGYLLRLHSSLASPPSLVLSWRGYRKRNQREGYRAGDEGVSYEAHC